MVLFDENLYSCYVYIYLYSANIHSSFEIVGKGIPLTYRIFDTSSANEASLKLTYTGFQLFINHENR